MPVTGSNLLFAIGLVALAATPLAHAASESQEPQEKKKPDEPRERVEVRALLPGEEDVAAFATTLDADEVRQRGEDLADLLRRVPGARVRDYGGIGSYATLSLRASTSQQVVVLVDGIPQNRALGGPVDLSSIPATQVDTVTVFRGFSPAAYGVSGIGGVVDVRTVAPTSAGGNVDVLVGEMATVRISGGGSFRTDSKGWLRVGGEALTSDGNFTYLDTGGTPFVPEDDGLTERVNNDVESTRLVLQHRRERLAGGDLRVTLRVQDGERGVPGVDGFPSATARLDESLTDLNAAWTRSFDGTFRRLDVIGDAFVQDIAFDDPDGDIGTAAQEHTTELAGGGIASIARWAPGRHRVMLRGDLRHEVADVTDTALAMPDRGGARRNLIALTAEDTLVFGRVTVAPSVRWELRDDDFVGSADGTVPPPADDVRQDNLAGKVSVAWTLDAHTSVRGSVGRTFRSPSLLELFGDRGSIAGNPNLQAEEGDAIEAGVVQQREFTRHGLALRWEAVGFARRTDDLILFVPASQGTAIARNIGAARVWGIEGAATLAWRFGLSLQGSLTWQQPTNAAGGFADGEPLPYQPEWLGYAGLAWQKGALLARWDVTYTGENSTTALDIPTFRIPERIIHDAYVGYTLAGHWRVGLDVRNVFDRRTRDVARYPLPDRTVLVSLGWSSRGTVRDSL